MRDTVLIIVSALCFFVCLIVIVSFAHCEDICFSEDTASNMIVELENCRILIQEASIYKEIVMNLEETIKNQEKIIELQKTIIDNANIIISQKDILIEQTKKACPKPSFLGEASKALGFIGLGMILITIL